MHVLLIEDDPDVATRYADALGRAGFVISTVTSPADAFKLLERQAVEAIVCDFTLPGEDGTTFYERLAARSPQLAERLLFVTGWSKDAKTSNLLEYTGRPVLTKPVDLEELTIAVRRLVGA